MNLLLDAGAFVALERNNRLVVALVKTAIRSERSPITHGGIIGQVWRAGARQARIASVLPMCRIAPLDEDLGRRAGTLLGRARRADVVDAALIALACDGDMVITSDPDDLATLAAAAGVHLDLIEV
jgi:hypothetical protein